MDDEPKGEAVLWSKSDYTGRYCIMLTDCTPEELKRLLSGKRSRLKTQIERIINVD